MFDEYIFIIILSTRTVDTHIRNEYHKQWYYWFAHRRIDWYPCNIEQCLFRFFHVNVCHDTRWQAGTLSLFYGHMDMNRCMHYARAFQNVIPTFYSVIIYRYVCSVCLPNTFGMHANLYWHLNIQVPAYHGECCILSDYKYNRGVIRLRQPSLS